MCMIEVRRTDEFKEWLRGLKDRRGKAKILIRIDRLSKGNPGDVEPVGNGISEMRISFGPGYRVYYTQRGSKLFLLLCGGDKDSQQRDVAKAKTLATEYQE